MRRYFPWPECRERDYADAVVQDVAVPARHDDREGRWCTARLRVHPCGELQEVTRRVVNPAGAELDLERSPAPVCGLHNGVDLQPRIVPVLEYFGIGGLRVHAQIANDQRFEEESEQLEVLQQVIGCGAERRHGERRIDEVSLWLAPEPGP